MNVSPPLGTRAMMDVCEDAAAQHPTTRKRKAAESVESRRVRQKLEATVGMFYSRF